MVFLGDYVFFTNVLGIRKMTFVIVNMMRESSGMHVEYQNNNAQIGVSWIRLNVLSVCDHFSGLCRFQRFLPFFFLLLEGVGGVVTSNVPPAASVS